MVRQTARVIILEILAGLGVLSILALAVLAIRLSSGPIELGFFKADIERTLESNRDGRRVTLENISLEWLADEKRAVVTASDLRLYDDADDVSAEAERAEILLETSGLLLGKVRPVGLVLEKGWIGVHQSEAGWSVAGDPIGAQQVANTEQETIRAEELLNMANLALIDVLSVLRRDAGALPLQSLNFSDVDIVFTQGMSGERGRLTQTAGGFTRDADGISLNVEGQTSGNEGSPASFSAIINAPGDYTRIIANVSLNDWSLESVANVFPALVGTVRELPSSLTVGLTASGENGLEQVTFQADAGAGEIIYGGERQTVRQVKLVGEYSPALDSLDIQLSDFDIGPARGDVSFVVEDVLKAEAVRRFTLNSPALSLNLTPIFSEAWDIKRLRVGGLLNLSNNVMDIETARLDVDEATLRASGKLKLLENVTGRDFPVELDMVAEMTGTLQPEQFMRFWPVKQAPPARASVTRMTQAGVINGATAQLRLRRDSLAKGYLSDESVVADFSIADARIKALHDIPAYANVNATGHMTGTTLEINFNGGTMGGVAIEKGRVFYPQLAPKGGTLMLEISGKGPAQNLLTMVSESRLQLQARTGFDPANVSGVAEMSMKMQRPARAQVPLSEYQYSAEGTIRAGGLAEAFNGLALTQSNARVTLDEKGIQVIGAGKIATSPFDYDWSYQFGGQNTPAVLKATSLLTPNILNAFGFVGRAYMMGEAPVDLEARLDGAKLRSIDVAFDLLSARLDVAELNWVKPVGQAASASLRYAIDDGAPTTAVTLNADDANFDATFTLEESGRLLAANIERAFLKDRADISGTAYRTDDQAVRFTLDGDFLDLSRLIPGVSTLGGNNQNAAARFGDVILDASIARLRLREGFETTNTTLSMVSSKDGMQTLEASGLLPNGADISGAYDASGLGDPTFLINSGDASFLASVFLGLDSLEEGTLQMSGTFATGDLPTQVRLVIENGRLKDAPFVTQILSLASFRGLSDTLSGDGVLFTRIEVPLTISNGRYHVVGARASGPALGLTANGWLRPASGEIDINGVLVPSFGINSALGGLPIIGDLFVSRQGEGVISLRYGIEGTLEKAQVSVNPLSAITPGVLRRIFENPSEEELPPIEEETAVPESIPGE